MSATASKSRRRVTAVPSHRAPATPSRQQPPPGEVLPLLTPQRCAVLLGRLMGLGAAGELLVDFPGNVSGRAVAAHASVQVEPGDLGKSVMLVFVNGDPSAPVIVGVLRGSSPEGSAADRRRRAVTVSIDGERLLLTAYQEVSLKCGKASIKLFRDGRVEVRGTDLLSRSSSVNRVKGGRVIIN